MNHLSDKSWTILNLDSICPGHPELNVTAMGASFHSYSVLVRICHFFAPICSYLQLFAVNFAFLR